MSSQAEQAVQAFFEQIRQNAKQELAIDAGVNRYTGKNFNSLKYLDYSETNMSWIIADLLNPVGEHGQGDLFLRLFMQHVLQDNNLPTHAVMVQRESYTANILRNRRRIDIMLYGESWACAIENKPRARQQEEQLEDYSNMLKSLGKKYAFLVFLAPLEMEPQKISIGQEGLRFWHLSEEGCLNISQKKCCKSIRLLPSFPGQMLARTPAKLKKYEPS